MIFSSLTGFLAGILHVVSGPDHLAAVAPFAAEKPQHSWQTGLLWGIGHTGGVWVIGILFFLMRELIPVELLSSWSERLVGIVLIAVGLWGLRQAFRHKIHAHAHAHDGDTHVHFHTHENAKRDHSHAAHHHAHAPLGIGVLHGLAGSSHLIGVLPALMLPSRFASIGYVVAYGLGSIVAMSFFSYLIGFLTQRFAVTTQVYNRVLGGFAVLAIGVGLFWITASL